MSDLGERCKANLANIEKKYNDNPDVQTRLNNLIEAIDLYSDEILEDSKRGFAIWEKLSIEIENNQYDEFYGISSILEENYLNRELAKYFGFHRVELQCTREEYVDETKFGVIKIVVYLSN